MINRILMADGYKYSHAIQYPQNTTSMFDYAEARSSKNYDKTFFFGLQRILMKYFIAPIEQWELDEAKEIFKNYGTYFDTDGWQYIIDELNGKIPVKIRAVQEGLVIPTGNALFTIESTDKRIFWMASWLETVLMTVWSSCNVATRSWYIRQDLLNDAELTQDVPNVDYQFHNFGARGSYNPEAASEAGLAHIAVGFRGSDNVSAFSEVQKYYTTQDLTDILHSINATEHSSTASWTKENEMKMIMNHLEQNKGQAIIASVCDTYDYYKCITEICRKDGEFQEKINSDEYPIFVMRPDSGNPAEIIPGTLDIMEKQEVPYTINSKGYKVFNKMRIIWGDGITDETMTVMRNILIERGYSTENIAFGSGGWLVQQHNRDTQGWAIKCSNVTVDGVERDVFKDPVTAPNKKSKKGKVTLWYNHSAQEYFTDKVDFKTNDFAITDMLNTVYENSEMKRWYSIHDVRNAQNSLIC